MNNPKVLTLWQPWATLLAAGAKQNETRPSQTSWRGTYLIHAAKKWDGWMKRLCYEEPFLSALLDLGINDPDDLPRGAIVGSFRVMFCVPVNEAILTGTERGFGDYSPGRWAWVGARHQLSPDPIPYSGGQGYYLNYTGDVSEVSHLIQPAITAPYPKQGLLF